MASAMSCAQATAEALYIDAQQRLIAVVVLDIALEVLRWAR
jgi:hypothetical protein